jgi:hypothetical protein
MVIQVVMWRHVMSISNHVNKVALSKLCNMDNIVLNYTVMGWQTTFILSKRAKGCHLITDEVLRHIRPGLNDVKASSTWDALTVFPLTGRSNE